MNKCFIALCFLLASAYTQAGDWEVFGDWKVRALHDDMDTVTKVVVTTGFNDTPKPGSPFAPKTDLTIGFIIYGGRLVTLSPTVGFVGEMYWPSCDYDLSSVSVDGKKAVRLTPVEDAGSCNNVAKNGEALRQMMSGVCCRSLADSRWAELAGRVVELAGAALLKALPELRGWRAFDVGQFSEMICNLAAAKNQRYLACRSLETQ